MNLDRMKSVLEAVADAGRPLTSVEVQHVTGLPRPTCYRILKELEKHAFLQSDADTGRWSLGNLMSRMTVMSLSDANVGSVVAPLLQVAASRHGSTFFLARYRRTGVEIIQVQPPEDPKVSYFHPGYSVRPVHACSCAKVIAAFSGDEIRKPLLKAARQQFTANTKMSDAQLLEDYQQIRSRGFAECVEEIETGVVSLAAPVFLANAQIPFSVGVVGSVGQLPADARSTMGKDLVELSGSLSDLIQAKLHSMQAA